MLIFKAPFAQTHHPSLGNPGTEGHARGPSQHRKGARSRCHRLLTLSKALLYLSETHVRNSFDRSSDCPSLVQAHLRYPVIREAALLEGLSSSSLCLSVPLAGSRALWLSFMWPMDCICMAVSEELRVNQRLRQATYDISQ